MYAVSFIYSNLSWHCFTFSIFQCKFFFLQGQWPFFTVTTGDDCLLHQTYRFTYRPRVWPLVCIYITIGNSIPSLRIFTFWWVSGWHRFMRMPPQTKMQNGLTFIIDCLSPGGVSWGGVFPKFSNIYTPTLPPKLHISGNAKLILPLMA